MKREMAPSHLLLSRETSKTTGLNAREEEEKINF
jgi:hypothetical protein